MKFLKPLGIGKGQRPQSSRPGSAFAPDRTVPLFDGRAEFRAASGSLEVAPVVTPKAARSDAPKPARAVTASGAGPQNEADRRRAFIDRLGDLDGQGQLHVALYGVEVLKEHNEKDYLPWYGRGWLALRHNQLEESLQCLTKAAELAPAVAEIRQSRGICLTSMGRLAEAVKSLETADQLAPLDPLTLFSLGLAYDFFRSPEKAIETLSRALELGLPREMAAEAWVHKGINVSELGSLEEAIRCYEQAVALDPNSVRAWYNKGVDEEHLGRREAAHRSYMHLLQLASSGSEVPNDILRAAISGVRELTGITNPSTDDGEVGRPE